MNKAVAAILIVAVLVCASGAYYIVSHDDDSGEGISDAAGNKLLDEYDDSRIMTVGVGTLRWTSYFGAEDKVVCIDVGDANASSWNGKAYRSLMKFDFGSEKLAQKHQPSESDIATYGIALHDHNGFSSENLEALHKWNEKPTLTIVSKSIYDGFNAEFIEGLSRLTKIVVIYEVDEFIDSDGNLSATFQSNLSILGKVLDKEDRATELRNGIGSFLDDIASLIDGKTSKYGKAYIGAPSLAGSKTLTYTVGNYLPFKIAGITNSYSRDSTLSVDISSEGMSSCNPDVIFMDLSGTSKFKDNGSSSVLEYAKDKELPMYTLLPYFWFGYNFDNAIANAYYLIYVCYDGVLTYEQCREKMADVYEMFMPNASGLTGEDSHGGEVILDNFDAYYGKTGSKLYMDGKQYICKNGEIVAA